MKSVVKFSGKDFCPSQYWELNPGALYNSTTSPPLFMFRQGLVFPRWGWPWNFEILLPQPPDLPELWVCATMAGFHYSQIKQTVHLFASRHWYLMLASANLGSQVARQHAKGSSAESHPTSELLVLRDKVSSSLSPKGPNVGNWWVFLRLFIVQSWSNQ